MVHVVGAVIVRGGLILAARRGPGRELAGMWEFPGGKVERDEWPTIALAREIREELDVEIQVGAHIETTTHEYPFATVTLDTYWATITTGEPTASEHSELRWCKADDLEKLDWAPADLPSVHKLLARLRAGGHPQSRR